MTASLQPAGSRQAETSQEFLSVTVGTAVRRRQFAGTSLPENAGGATSDR